MKYVILEADGKRHAILFSKALTHREMYLGARSSLWTDGVKEVKAVSAGFYAEKNNVVRTWGESETLDLKALPGDHLFITDVIGEDG